MLDLRYWPRLPTDKTDVYLNLEHALRGLQRHIQPLTLSQAQVDGEIAGLLAAFGTALEAAKKALGENETRRLWDTLGHLVAIGVRWGGYAARLLQCGSIMTHFPGSREESIEKIRNVVREILSHLYLAGDQNEMWHEIKERILEYADALLTALNPNGFSKTPQSKRRRRNGHKAKAPHDPKMEARDKWIYSQCCKGPEMPLLEIVANLKKQASVKGWEPIESVQGIRSAAIKYAKRNELEPPPSRHNK